MIDKEIVALYVRVSTQEQAREGYSIEEQKDKLIKYAEAHGWIIYNTKKYNNRVDDHHIFLGYLETYQSPFLY